MKQIFKTSLLLIFFLGALQVLAGQILIPMDEKTQKNHLKAYGIAYWVLAQDLEIHWLLNYRGGSFLLPDTEPIRRECLIRGVNYEPVSSGEVSLLFKNIASPSVNMEAVKLEKAPKIAVYSPDGNQPWDDAVTLVLTYAEIPYDRIYDQEVLDNLLPTYDWLHLHHEDFTGQYGKFYAAFRNAPWYIQQKQEAESAAKMMGFSKVSQQKLAVAKKIREYVAGGGFMFAMCSATDSYDIALSAEGLDICEPMFDGDGTTPNYNNKLNYEKTFAFKNFKLVTNPMEYEFSDIDMTGKRNVRQDQDLFTLFEFSAKWDWVPTMLTQNHTRVVKGFMGQTTAFDKTLIKSDVLILGEMKAIGEARYIHGSYGNGTWTFYGGHDPEDYQHRVGDPPTELDLHPNSPGYRLILNNILFPAAQKEKQKT
jgi:hypothetical protein